jgi:hypothetical protein
MPDIPLPEQFPGVSCLFAFRPKTADGCSQHIAQSEYCD